MNDTIHVKVLSAGREPLSLTLDSENATVDELIKKIYLERQGGEVENFDVIFNNRIVSDISLQIRDNCTVTISRVLIGCAPGHDSPIPPRKGSIHIRTTQK